MTSISPENKVNIFPETPEISVLLDKSPWMWSDLDLVRNKMRQEGKNKIVPFTKEWAQSQSPQHAETWQTCVRILGILKTLAGESEESQEVLDGVKREAREEEGLRLLNELMEKLSMDRGNAEFTTLGTNTLRHFANNPTMYLRAVASDLISKVPDNFHRRAKSTTLVQRALDLLPKNKRNRKSWMFGRTMTIGLFSALNIDDSRSIDSYEAASLENQ